MKNAYLVGYTGWGSLENLYLALDCASPKAAVEQFLKEVELDPDGVYATAAAYPTEQDLTIFVYPLGKERVFVPKAVEYREKR